MRCLDSSRFEYAHQFDDFEKGIKAGVRFLTEDSQEVPKRIEHRQRFKHAQVENAYCIIGLLRVWVHRLYKRCDLLRISSLYRTKKGDKNVGFSDKSIAQYP